MSENPLINFGWNAHTTPIEAFYVVLGIGAGLHIIGIIICFKFQIKEGLEILAEIILFAVGYTAGVMTALAVN